MRQPGIGLWILGLLIFVYATFVFDVSVSVDPPISGDLDSVKRIVNIQLQQRQLLLALAGSSMFVAGAIVHAIAAALESVCNRSGNETLSNSEKPNKRVTELVQTEIDDEVKKFGITFWAGKWRYGPNRFDRVEDAVAYARLHPVEAS